MRSSVPLEAPRWRQRVAVAAAGVAACGVVGGCAVSQFRRRQPGAAPAPNVSLPRPLVDAMAGAFGEVAQICMLYPLETIKVRCQADGISAAEVVRSMVAKYGFGPVLVSRLYSGFASAALFSCAVGAVHWLSFCAAKRFALQSLPLGASAAAGTSAAATATASKQASTSTSSALPANGAATAAGSSSSDSPSAHHQTVVSSAHHHHHVHVSSGHHPHDEAAGTSGNGSQGDLSSKTSANLFAAIVGALATALIESPVELFRHKAQAGLISGNLVAEMGRSIRTGGPGALWTGFLPFCLEAFPYDCSELGSYSQLRDVYDELSKPGSRLHAFCSRFPDHMWDLAIGGAAGAAAVMVSMPFDCIKTYMQTHDTGITGASAARQVQAFFMTGQSMVQRRGPGALFVGIVPRLVQQIPSSTICWWSVEQAQKMLEPYVTPDSK